MARYRQIDVLRTFEEALVKRGHRSMFNSDTCSLTDPYVLVNRMNRTGLCVAYNHHDEKEVSASLRIKGFGPSLIPESELCDDPASEHGFYGRLVIHAKFTRANSVRINDNTITPFIIGGEQVRMRISRIKMQAKDKEDYLLRARAIFEELLNLSKMPRKEFRKDLKLRPYTLVWPND